jgi:hypothetical protein
MACIKKAQVLLTEKQYRILKKIASKTHKKPGVLIREAVEKVYMAEDRKTKIAEAVDRLLSLPPTPMPDDYRQWEKEYSKLKQPCDLQ